MDFTFPENKALHNGIIKNFLGKPNRNYKVSKIDILKPKLFNLISSIIHKIYN